MPIKLKELLNSRQDIKPSQEAYEEQLRVMQTALRKVEHLKNTMPSRDVMMKEFAYINTVLSSPVSISQEDDQMTAIGKLDGARKELVTKIQDTEGNVPPLKAEEIKDEAIANTELPQEEPKEVEPIVKYPLNEKTLTKYAITSPNLLSAAGVVLTEKGRFINKEEPASIVDTARVLLDDASKRTEFVHVAKETYDESLPLIDNVVKFFNTSKGNKWLVSKEGKKWINYVMYKHPVALENARIVPEDDFEILTKEEDAMLESQDEIIAMEDTNAVDVELTQTLPQGYIDTDNDEDTMRELSDNADKISRLEEQATLIQAGIDNIDELQANGSLSVESAVTYIKVLDELKSQVAKNMKIDTPAPIEVSTEDLQYDPVGGLSIAREGLVEILRDIYMFLKKNIIKLIKFVKYYFNKNFIHAKMMAGKANFLIKELSNKKPLTNEQFETIKTNILETYRPILYVINYDIVNFKGYLDALVSNGIRRSAQQPLKDIYSVLNKLNTDISTSNKENIIKDTDKIIDIISKDNIFNRAFKGRNPYIVKLDKVVDLKQGDGDVLPIAVNKDTAYGLLVAENNVNGKTYYSYDIKKLEFNSLSGDFNHIFRTNDIKTALQRITLCPKDFDFLRKEIINLNKYSESFIEAFGKFTKDKFFKDGEAQVVGKAINSLVSYAKTICIKYALLDITTYLKTSKAAINICSDIVKGMEQS